MRNSHSQEKPKETWQQMESRILDGILDQKKHIM